MFLYTTIEAIVAVVAGIFIAVCTKRTDGVIYGKLAVLDLAGLSLFLKKARVN